ncbi:uncharacterized protein LOC126797417 [Argentina anserina]|uniref:uncharacterized protein LOC126797417 n=1 Tax=Argentina anserina TaxID=57926 RepID=UPI0021765FD0|nr:uncharacterized protein LOC126797417 [Potentilla anserina]
MKKGSGASLDLGTLPGQKGWNSERVRTLSNNVGGRTLGSKWEDAERWICSPNLGLGDERSKDLNSHGQKRRPKSKSGPIVPPGALYYSHNSPTNTGFEGGSLRNFVTAGSPFSTGVLAADSVCLSYGGMGRSASLLGMQEFQNEKFDDSSSEEQMVARAVSQRDMGTQISQNTKGCLQSSPTRRRSSFAPSSPTLVPIVEQQREHFARLEVREVQVDNRVMVVEGTKGGVSESTKKSPPDVNDFGTIAFQDQTPSSTIAEAAMNTSRLQREEAKINAWENLQRAKAEAALRKLEMKLEKKKSSTMDKIMKKLSRAQVKANKMRSSMAVTDGHQVPETPRKARSFSKRIRMGSLQKFFTCNAF